MVRRGSTVRVRQRASSDSTWLLALPDPRSLVRDSRIDGAELAKSLGSILPTTIAVRDNPVNVAAGGGAVWVVKSGDQTISRIEPGTNKVVATIELENEPIRVAVGNGLAWVTVQGARKT